MPLRNVRFVLAFEPSYARMATSLIRSLTILHPECPIVVYTLDDHLTELRSWAGAHGFRHVSVASYRPATLLSFGEWHPLVWAKLEAFAGDPDVMQVILDVDQILYHDLSGCIAEAVASGKTISASPDITDLGGHLLDSFTPRPTLSSIANVSCFNAGAMIVRPSRGAYTELVGLAERHHRDVRLPEQAILNLWARRNGGHHDLGDKFMIEPWSPKLVEPTISSCLVHFWTPRPEFFGANPVRSLEPEWGRCLEAFQHKTGQPYPLDRFEVDFLTRLNGNFNASADV